MKILTINREKTKAWNQVAFNVDEPLASDVFRMVRYGVMKLRLEGNVLHCSFPDNGTNGGIMPRTIEGLNEAFALAQSQADAKAAELARQHDRMLDQVSTQSGIPLE